MLTEHQPDFAIVGGDLNLIAVGDMRLNPAMPEAAHPASALSGFLEKEWSGLCEIRQPAFTRIQRTQGEPTLLSTIDRLFVWAPALDLIDACPEARTLCSCLDRSIPSDHVPVIANLRPLGSSHWPAPHP